MARNGLVPAIRPFPFAADQTARSDLAGRASLAARSVRIAARPPDRPIVRPAEPMRSASATALERPGPPRPRTDRRHAHGSRRTGRAGRRYQPADGRRPARPDHPSPIRRTDRRRHRPGRRPSGPARTHPPAGAKSARASPLADPHDPTQPSGVASLRPTTIAFKKSGYFEETDQIKRRSTTSLESWRLWQFGRAIIGTVVPEVAFHGL